MIFYALDVPLLTKNQIIRVFILAVLVIGIFHLMYLPFYKMNKKIMNDK